MQAYLFLNIEKKNIKTKQTKNKNYVTTTTNACCIVCTVSDKTNYILWIKF